MYTLYHNNRCSKSREALALLEQKKVEFTIRNYLDVPLSASELSLLIQALQLPIRSLMRTKEPQYKELGLDNQALTDAQLFDALLKNPKLLERPILQKQAQAVIGRPCENLLALLP